MKTTLSLATLAAAALLTGCSSHDPNNVSYRHIHKNLTPELRGTAERPVDVNRNLSVMANQDKRMFSDDINRFFYLDHPSRLSPFPITYTSGMPR